MTNEEKTMEIWRLLNRLHLTPRQAARILRGRGLMQISDNIIRDITACRWRYAVNGTWKKLMRCLEQLEALEAPTGDLLFEADVWLNRDKIWRFWADALASRKPGKRA